MYCSSPAWNHELAVAQVPAFRLNNPAASSMRFIAPATYNLIYAVEAPRYLTTSLTFARYRP